MTGPERFRILATHIVGRAVDVAEAAAGEPAYTTGSNIFVAKDQSPAEQRREVVLQGALLAARSLDAQWVKALRARISRA